MSRFVIPEDREKLENFYKEAYGDNHILNNTVYQKWQFEKNPFNKLNTKSIVIIENEGIVYAHLGLFPVELKIFNSIKEATWFIPYYVLKKYRIVGLGFRLMDFVSEKFSFSMALNVSDDSRKIFSKDGWTNFSNINRYIGILDKNRVEKFSNKKISAEHLKLIQTIEFDFQRVDSLDKSYDDFWDKVNSKYPITINRKREYVIWRYIDNPLTDYHFLVLHDNKKIVGYVVLRFEDQNQVLKAARIVDLIVIDKYEIPLLQHVISYCSGKVDFIDFFCTGNFHEKSLTSVGFLKNESEKINLPTVFNPIDPERKTIIEFLYKNNEKNLEIDGLNDIDNWYIIKGDSDQDRAY